MVTAVNHSSRKSFSIKYLAQGTCGCTDEKNLTFSNILIEHTFLRTTMTSHRTFEWPHPHFSFHLLQLFMRFNDRYFCPSILISGYCFSTGTDYFRLFWPNELSGQKRRLKVSTLSDIFIRLTSTFLIPYLSLSPSLSLCLSFLCLSFSQLFYSLSFPFLSLIAYFYLSLPLAYHFLISIYLSIFRSICMIVYIAIYSSILLSVCLIASPSLSVYLSAWLFEYLCTHLCSIWSSLIWFECNRLAQDISDRDLAHSFMTFNTCYKVTVMERER